MHQRMDDAFELLESSAVAQHTRSKCYAVDLPMRGGARKCRFNRRHRLTLIEAVHNGVGILHRLARFCEKTRGGGLAHSERASQAEHKHDVRGPSTASASPLDSLCAARNRAAVIAANQEW